MANVFYDPEVTAKEHLTATKSYYESLSKCVHCNVFFPGASTHGACLCPDCLELEDAQWYKVEKEVEISKD